MKSPKMDIRVYGEIWKIQPLKTPQSLFYFQIAFSVLNKHRKKLDLALFADLSSSYFNKFGNALIH